MPSKHAEAQEAAAPIERIVASLNDARERYRSAVAQTVEEVSVAIEVSRPAEPGSGRVQRELGEFAMHHIDADRFAALLGEQKPVDPDAAMLLERARATLTELLALGDALYRIDVPPRASLACEIGTALAASGRAFGAALVAGLARTGRIAQADRDDACAAFPFSRWTFAERAIAPPLVVEVDGGDLQCGGIAAFLCGTQKIALIVRAPAPPAALVRLITPGVFVMQTNEPADLARFATFDGPAVTALVPPGCARFVHDPTATPRLAVQEWPEQQPRKAVGSVSVFQQEQELRQLEALVAQSATSTAPLANAASVAGDGTVVSASIATAPAAPVDRLASWLLVQAGLAGNG